MIRIRKLRQSDSEDLNRLINQIQNSLANQLFWLPINDESKKHFLDDEWCYFLGAFDNKKLIAGSCLFLNEHEYKESQLFCDLPIDEKTAEIGRSMVLPKYRGNNLLYQINLRLLEKARELEIKNIIVTIHPENIASLKSFHKINAQFLAKTKKCEIYDRNIYLIKL